MRRTFFAIVAWCLLPAAMQAGWLNDPENSYELRLAGEMGTIGVVEHTIQFGRGGTKFDYVRDGGQNILLPFNRMSAELHLGPRHAIIFLYQPLDVRTQATLVDPLIVDSDTFVTGTPVRLRYGFDFYRASYLYDFWRDPERELAIGLSLQLRNASISFASEDGRQQRVYQNLGPVPILKFRSRLPLTGRIWFGTEIDGFYAQGKVVTGSTNVEGSFKGAILDASLRYGMRLNDALDGFINVRYLGGGASGSQVKAENPGSGYTDNWLNTISLTLGCYLR